MRPVKERSQWEKRDKRIPDENRSRLGARSDLEAAGSGMESKKPRDKDTELYTIHMSMYLIK